MLAAKRSLWPGDNIRRHEILGSSTERFTLDGSESLESRLAAMCEAVNTAIMRVVPVRRLDALVLGGGYGRGQGGVLQSPEGDQPYNDLEFYLFLKGNRLFNEWRYGRELNWICERLSRNAGLHVECKISSLQELRQSQVSIFSYDLVAGHRMILGSEKLFPGCGHHLQPDKIAVSEAARLLFNRCSGLLLAKALLKGDMLTDGQADFVGRNLAKLQLALGDAVLAAGGQYHWDCLERHHRLTQLAAANPWLKTIVAHHRTGVKFKLHPRCTMKPAQEFRAEFQTISKIGLELWLALESLRLRRLFRTVEEYVFSREIKIPESPLWRNLLLNLRTFRLKAFGTRLIGRYPRERLLKSLPLLLWESEVENRPELRRHVQKLLQAGASDWAELVEAYRRLWPKYA